MGCELPECCLYTLIQLSKDVRKIVVKTTSVNPREPRSHAFPCLSPGMLPDPHCKYQRKENSLASGALSWDKVFSQWRPFHRISTPGSAQNPAEVNEGGDPI